MFYVMLATAALTTFSAAVGFAMIRESNRDWEYAASCFLLGAIVTLWIGAKYLG